MKNYVQSKVDIEYYLKNIHTVDALKDIILDNNQCKVLELMKKENFHNKLEEYRNRNKPEYIYSLKGDIKKYFKEKSDNLTNVDVKLLNYVEDDILIEL